MYKIILHGGTDNFLSEPPRLAVVTQALQVGQEILRTGGRAVDAVQATVEVLEDSGLFNAGKGSVKNVNGVVEQDACIMSGEDLQVSAVGALQMVKNPIRAAKKMWSEKKIVLLVGEGARTYAIDRGLETTTPDYYQPSIPSQKPKDYYGTVGAIALDQNGNLAAATSSGGLENKPAGRLGDSPIAGSGTYANNQTCAVSATGMGELFLRVTAAFRVSAAIEYGGVSLQEAAAQAIEKVSELGGVGALIALNTQGEWTLQGNVFTEVAGLDSSQKLFWSRI